MTSNEERIARLEGIAEGIRGELGSLRAEIGGLRAEIGGIHAEMGDLRAEIRSIRQDLQTEIRSNRNTLLMVNLLLWMTTIGTLFGLFFGVR